MAGLFACRNGVAIGLSPSGVPRLRTVSAEIRLTGAIVIDGKAQIISWAILPRRRATIEDVEVRYRAIRQIGIDAHALLAARETAEAVDAPFQVGIAGDQGIAQGFALDEIVRQLIERPVEPGVGQHIRLIGPDQDFSIAQMIAIESETGTLADHNAVGARARLELIGNFDRFIKDEVEDFQFPVEHQEKANRSEE